MANKHGERDVDFPCLKLKKIPTCSKSLFILWPRDLTCDDLYTVQLKEVRKSIVFSGL